MASPAYLQIKDVYFSYRHRWTLQGVSLEIEEGEFLGLVGPNGAGKTTLLRTINGLVKPSLGAVNLEGTSVHDFTSRERARKMAALPEDPTIPRGFTALETVLMGRNPHLGFFEWEKPEDVKIARRAMEITNTWEFAWRKVSALSGGERQRVLIARALAQEAPVLLLDEPTAHLDIGFQAEILHLVKNEIQTEARITVLAAIHDLTLAAQYCDRLGVLCNGRVLTVGRPAEVLTSEVISRAFGTEVHILKHPVEQTPVVILHKSGKSRLPLATGGRT